MNSPHFAIFREPQAAIADAWRVPFNEWPHLAAWHTRYRTEMVGGEIRDAVAESFTEIVNE